MSESELVKKLVRRYLKRLTEDLERFGQTTHSAFASGRIEDVATRLVQLYQDPRAFTISDFSQVVDKLLETDGKP